MPDALRAARLAWCVHLLTVRICIVGWLARNWPSSLWALRCKRILSGTWNTSHLRSRRKQALCARPHGTTSVLLKRSTGPNKHTKEGRQGEQTSLEGQSRWTFMEIYGNIILTEEPPIVSILRCPTTWTNLAVTPKLLADLLKYTINQAKPPNTSQHLAILEPKYLESFCRQAQHGYTADSRHHGTGELTGTNTGEVVGSLATGASQICSLSWRGSLQTTGHAVITEPTTHMSGLSYSVNMSNLCRV